ncbi:hypothetical protein AAF695_02585 [Aerococcus viridans]
MEITIGVIVAFVALLSPIITTCLNNHHQMKIKKIEIKEERNHNERLYKRDLCERYLEAVGILLCEHSKEAAEELSISNSLLTPFIPEYERSDFKLFSEDISEEDAMIENAKDIKITYRDKIIPTIEKILK